MPCIMNVFRNVILNISKLIGLIGIIVKLREGFFFSPMTSVIINFEKDL